MKYKVVLISPLGLLPAGMPAAQAGDVTLPPNAQPVKYEKFTPAWSGFYAGVNVGVAADQSRQTAFKPTGAGPTYCFGGESVSCSFSNSQTGVGIFGGYQIGYNFQNGNLVYGAEADFGISSARQTTSGPNAAPNAFFGNWTAKTGLEALSTMRLRLGYTFDRALVYGTGGLAYAKLTNTFQAAQPSSTDSYSWSDTAWRRGFAVGGGVEYMLLSNVSIKGEALFYDFGKQDHISYRFFSPGQALGLTDRMTGVVARIGLNYLVH
jgi:outer membrane immunogenic protein